MVAFNPSRTLTLALGSGSAGSALLPSGSQTVVVAQDGSGPCWLTFSKGSQTASAGSSPNIGVAYPLMPGQAVQLSVGSVDTVNGFSTSGCNLYVTTGQGDFAGSGGGASGGGGGGLGAVNLTQVGGAPISLGANTSANSIPMAPATDALWSITGTVTASGTMNLAAVTSGGASRTSVIISSTTASVIKATAGQVYGLSLDNNSAAPYYAKIYDAASATVGTGTPVIRMMCPGPTNGGGGSRDWASIVGVQMTTGICLIVTQNQADADTIAVPASVATATVYWK